MAKYTSEIHRFVDEWLRAHRTNWETLRKKAGVSAPVGTDIRRGSTPRPATLRKLADAMDVPLRTLYEISGYVDPAELDPQAATVPDDYEIQSFFADHPWSEFTDDEQEVVRMGIRMALSSKKTHL